MRNSRPLIDALVLVGGDPTSFIPEMSETLGLSYTVDQLQTLLPRRGGIFGGMGATITAVAAQRAIIEMGAPFCGLWVRHAEFTLGVNWGIDFSNVSNVLTPQAHPQAFFAQNGSAAANAALTIGGVVDPIWGATSSGGLGAFFEHGTGAVTRGAAYTGTRAVVERTGRPLWIPPGCRFVATCVSVNQALSYLIEFELPAVTPPPTNGLTAAWE